MSKLKVVDAVVFSQVWVEALQDDTPLDLYQPQIVSETRVSGDVKIQGDDDWWDESYWEPFEEWAKHQKVSLSYQNCNGEIQQLDKFHLHELVDRVHCVQVMIQELLMDHPASGLVGNKFRLASEQLGDAYQQLGRISFDEFGERK